MTRHYDIGKGRPPKASQFQKGRSGNPKGRARKLATPAPTSRLARHKMLALSRQPMPTTSGGKEVTRDLWDAANIAHVQMGLKGGHRSLSQIRREMAQAAAEEEQERSDQYQFWRRWKRDHAEAPLYCAAHPERKLPWPHPADIGINAISRVVTFLGPLDADELPLYLAVLEVAELYLVEAELTARACGDGDPLVRYLRSQAYESYRNAAPSLGGPHPEEDDDALLHRMTVLVLDIRAMGISELRARRTALFSRFCAALATLDLPVPHWPPLRMAVPVRRPQMEGAKKRHRLCSVARNNGLRSSVHERIGQGHGVERLARSTGKTRASRSVIARYVRLYKRIKGSWMSAPELQSKELPASLREFRKAFAHFLVYLSDRDLSEKERLRRQELPLRPDAMPAKGATPEAINFIKAQLLGLDVEPPAETMD